MHNMLLGRRKYKQTLRKPELRFEDNIKMNLPRIGYEGVI